MAIKSDFEGDSQINSPFVDEIANPGSTGGVLGQIKKNVDIQSSLLGTNKSAPSAKISKADREARITSAQKLAQARVDLADKRFGDPKNKNKEKAEGR